MQRSSKGSYLQPGRESDDLKRKWGLCHFCESIKTQKTSTLLIRNVGGGGRGGGGGGERGERGGSAQWERREAVTDVICGVKISSRPEKTKVIFLKINK